MTLKEADETKMAASFLGCFGIVWDAPGWAGVFGWVRFFRLASIDDTFLGCFAFNFNLGSFEVLHEGSFVLGFWWDLS